MKIKVFNIRLSKEHLESDQNKVNAFLEHVDMKKSSTSLIEGKTNYWSLIVHYLKKDQTAPDQEVKPENHKTETKKPKLTESDLSQEELIIADSPKQWRKDKSQKEMRPSYMILSNADIYSVAKDKPSDFSELLNVHGFGEKKVEKYGDDIISLLNAL
ncbi:HRDC domain-containing protein [Seonamhaeicola sp.]|uniref:HRDC domain-containing protein n=1 Tax=Seonamhaeicola sp. TaxID=1912245 RepID=UPI00261ACE8D|nr:HRDC domain-containing protein [Seonamhaeicola sp.]